MFTVRYSRQRDSQVSNSRHAPGEGSASVAPSTLEQDSPLLAGDGEANIDTYGNETRRLRGTRAAFQRPWHRDKRWWIRWPAQAWHVTGHRLIPQDQSSEYRPASHWWSRWLAKIWWLYRRLSGSNDLFYTLRESYLNLMLVFLPLAFAAAHWSWSPDIVLAFNFLAIIPLSGLVHLACEDLSANLSPTVGRLLVAFSDNLVELVVCITPTYGIAGS